jgi:hypothetical protein
MSSVMDMNEADILDDSDTSVSAKHYAIYELDKLTDSFTQAWMSCNGVVIKLHVYG